MQQPWVTDDLESGPNCRIETEERNMEGEGKKLFTVVALWVVRVVIQTTDPSEC